jgi:hypothetical protein
MRHHKRNRDAGFLEQSQNTPAKLDDVFYYGFSENQVLDLAGQRSMTQGEGRIIDA